MDKEWFIEIKRMREEALRAIADIPSDPDNPFRDAIISQAAHKQAVADMFTAKYTAESTVKLMRGIS